MTRDEGVIKYRSDWTSGPVPDAACAREIGKWRLALFDAGFIGRDAGTGIGYGNISLRVGSTSQFIITGSQTGHVRDTGAQHYSLVTGYDIDANRVRCTGPVAASSEAMTHAAIYELDEEFRAVVHVHNSSLWRSGRDILPTTRADVAYGTPEMAGEFSRLYRDTDFASGGLAVMAGHEDGVVCVGGSLEQAAKRALTAFRSLQG